MSEDPPRTAILVAEDEYLLACLLQEDLQHFGYRVVGPFPRLSEAIEAARCEAFDLAILDVNLNGELVYPLAEELLQRKIPFLFLSGYNPENFPDHLKAVPKVRKPYDPASLEREIRRVFTGRD